MDWISRNRARGWAPWSNCRSAAPATGRCSSRSESHHRRPAARRKASCRFANCGCCPWAPPRCRARGRKASSRENPGGEWAPCPTPCLCLRLWPTILCCENHCRQRARPAGQELRWRACSRAARRPRRAAIRTRAEPWWHRGRGEKFCESIGEHS